MKLSDNTVGVIPGYFSKKLEGVYSEREATQLAQWSLEFILGYSKSEVILNANQRLSESELLGFIKISDRLKNHEPFQYITGRSYFMDLELTVDKNVLIPRPETEELVDWILNDNHTTNVNKIRIKDIATGSGCIALALASKLKNATIEGTDIDSKALLVARKNAESLQLDVQFRMEDALNLTDTANQYDVIVSNPPYILKEEAKTMDKNVLNFEPHLALFVEKDPLVFYKHISQYAEQALVSGGRLYFELHEQYGRSTYHWMKENSALKVIELKKDLQGKDRMLKCEKL